MLRTWPGYLSSRLLYMWEWTMRRRRARSRDLNRLEHVIDYKTCHLISFYLMKTTQFISIILTITGLKLCPRIKTCLNMIQISTPPGVRGLLNLFLTRGTWFVRVIRGLCCCLHSSRRTKIRNVWYSSLHAVPWNTTPNCLTTSTSPSRIFM